MTDVYRVIAPYATLRVRDFTGVSLRGFYADALLPAETLQEDVDDHLAKGMVEKVDAGEAKQVDKTRADAAKAADEAAKQAIAGDDAAAKAAADAAKVDEAAKTAAAKTAPGKAAG